ncbi:hypothetical protein [Bradyrhizobium sp.]
MIGYLFFRTRDESDFNKSSDPSRAKLLALYRALFEMYARKPNWSRSDREEIGGCLFDAVVENLPPVCADAKSLATQR